MYHYNTLYIYNDFVGTSIPPNLLRTSTSASTKSSTKASTGGKEGRGLVTKYSWNPPAAENSSSWNPPAAENSSSWNPPAAENSSSSSTKRKLSEKRLNEDASKNCIIVVLVL